MRPLLPTALALALALGAHAQPGPAPAPPAAGDWQLVPAQTKVLFSVIHFPFGAYHGRFDGASGVLQFDPKNLAASRLEVKVPIDGVVAETPDFTAELKGPEWFDGARHPFMTFRSRSITSTGPNQADVTGDLTLRGITRPVSFKAVFSPPTGANPLDKPAQPGFEVRGVIRRREFGMTRYEPFVSDDVRIVITGAFGRSPS
jgi:polyisoprenoid-binding protein YceI